MILISFTYATPPCPQNDEKTYTETVMGSPFSSTGSGNVGTCSTSQFILQNADDFHVFIGYCQTGLMQQHSEWYRWVPLWLKT
jgi:hypothetical protein